MPHINDLPTVVLRKILYHAAATSADTLFSWKSKLPLLAVCQTWTTLALPFIFNHVYVEAFGACDNSESSVEAPGFDACIGWTSNAELFISRHCFLLARQLTIDMLYGITPYQLRHIALDILKLDWVDWMHINSLTIVSSSIACGHDNKQAGVDDSIKADFSRTMEYFKQNVRNVVKLDLTEPFLGAMGDLICDYFATIYSGQLQILRAQGSVPLPISQFTQNLVELELTLDLEAACVLPSVCGETLRVLKLVNVPHNFAWYHFRYDIFAHPIVFSRLAILHLFYSYDYTEATEDEVQGKVASGAVNCDQLHFPVLKELGIRNCTPDCDLLYADISFPELERVRLSGTADNLRHCRRLKLGWVGDLHVEIDMQWNELSTDFYDATNHFFSNICIGRTAALDLDLPHHVIRPDLVRWANLTYLEIATVRYETLCKLIAQLPNLSGITTYSLEFDSSLEAGVSVDESLFRSTDPLLAWGERLATITVVRLDDHHAVAAGAYIIQAIIVHANALKKLTVPRSIQPLLAAFIDKRKSRFPHLAKTELASDVY
ncbi:hypothetical protein GGI20_001035 [Coemansia sp. BCRC 34301]|nr:hypothetical protein GGI20_001035 [Coemansia sp. BCRC 34301]